MVYGVPVQVLNLPSSTTKSEIERQFVGYSIPETAQVDDNILKLEATQSCKG